MPFRKNEGNFEADRRLRFRRRCGALPHMLRTEELSLDS